MTSLLSKSFVYLEEKKRLSESNLWEIQREFFDKEGINAWVQQVPFYITSNPFIAHCYAKVVLNFIRDWIKNHPENKDFPFYIMELGTGSGQFSFYVIKTLMEFLHSLNMGNIRICYVMSDITLNNIKYHATHSAFLPYIEKGLVDFAIYNMETEKPIHLLQKNITLDNQTLKNPLIVFANYIFDTISQDAFTVRNKKLYELLISIKTEKNNIQDNRPIHLDKLETEYHLNEIDSSYYSDPVLNKILEEYKNNLQETSFLFPTGPIHSIQYLSKLSNDKLLVISSDKGYGSVKSLDQHGHPSFTFHGSFSIMVNFHALAQFFKNSGGDYLIQSPRKGIKTSIFCKGFRLDTLPYTSLAIQEYIEGFSPTDYFNLHRHISDSYQNCDLDTLASHLNLTHWDPYMYLKLKNRIISLVKDAEPDTIEFMINHMSNIADNYYQMPKTECVLFEIGIFFHAVKRCAEALQYYEKSRAFMGNSFILLYNTALCQHHLELNEKALATFKHALVLNPESKETKEWITFLSK